MVHCPSHTYLEPLLCAIAALGAGDMAKDKPGMDLAFVEFTVYCQDAG